MKYFMLILMLIVWAIVMNWILKIASISFQGLPLKGWEFTILFFLFIFFFSKKLKVIKQKNEEETICDESENVVSQQKESIVNCINSVDSASPIMEELVRERIFKEKNTSSKTDTNNFVLSISQKWKYAEFDADLSLDIERCTEIEREKVRLYLSEIKANYANKFFADHPEIFDEFVRDYSKYIGDLGEWFDNFYEDVHYQGKTLLTESVYESILPILDLGLGLAEKTLTKASLGLHKSELVLHEYYQSEEGCMLKDSAKIIDDTLILLLEEKSDLEDTSDYYKINYLLHEQRAKIYELLGNHESAGVSKVYFHHFKNKYDRTNPRVNESFGDDDLPF